MRHSGPTWFHQLLPSPHFQWRTPRRDCTAGASENKRQHPRTTEPPSSGSVPPAPPTDKAEHRALIRRNAWSPAHYHRAGTEGLN